MRGSTRARHCRRFLLSKESERRGGAHNWPLMLYWTVSPGDLRGDQFFGGLRPAIDAPRPIGAEQKISKANSFIDFRADLCTPSAEPGRRPSCVTFVPFPRVLVAAFDNNGQKSEASS